MFFLPPDTKSDAEWWLVMFIVNALTGIRSGWGVFMLFVGVFLILGYVTYKLFMLTLTRLWDIYRTGSAGSSVHSWILKGIGVLLIVLWIFALGFASDPDTVGLGSLLFTGSLFIFTIIFEVIDWFVEKKETQEAAALPEDISLEDILSWRRATGKDKEAVGGKSSE